MNKQEAIKELYCKKNQAENTYAPNKWSEGHKNGVCEGLKDSIKVVEQLDEPEKTVVPQFVADFYESIKDDFELGVYNLCVRLYTCNLEGKIKYWFDCDDKKPIETLAKMKLFGYEVEKEKLYRVELPGSHKHGDIILVKDDDGDITYDVVFSDKWKERDYTKLTESEIKEDFAWAWQFAKEVEDD
ncbi:hypothetical protein Si103_00761 [Streptococcus infantarius subsp. infantarius]|nr:hypothetical protein [Streptococcus infantarius subsp. infantarius]MCO4564559.1 hypothetical protein [Streptococcus infantarius subsp. infantarius]